MIANKQIARAAGFLYLIVIVTGMFSLLYVPDQLIDWNSSTVTYNNIASSPMLFRLGIYGSVVCYVAFIFLPIILYKLLRSVNETWAKLMVILALLSVPLSLYNLQQKYAALSLAIEPYFLNSVKVEDIQNNLMRSLHKYNDGILLATIFWGLWLLPFGLLVYKSGFIPKLLGVLLIGGCVGYLTNFTGYTLYEDYSNTAVVKYISNLPAIAEISICIWLLFFGIKEPQNGK